MDRATAGEMMGRFRRLLPTCTLVVATHDPTLITEAFVGALRVTLEAGPPVPALRG